MLSSIVVRVTGHAETSNDCTEWRALKQGELLLPGSVIKTTTNSLVDLWLGGKPEPLRYPKSTSRRRFYVPETRYLLRILENSVVGIDRVAGEQMSGRTNRLQEIQLDLRAGSVAGSFPKGAGETQGLIRFTNGLSRVEYGLFTLSASGGIEVWRGKAVISVAGRNSSREVTGPHRFDPLADIVTELPDAGHLHPPAVSVELPQPQPATQMPEPARKF